MLERERGLEKISVGDEEKRRRLTAVVMRLASSAETKALPFEIKDEEKYKEGRRELLQEAMHNRGLSRLVNSKPVFYENQENARREIHFEAAFEHLRSRPEVEAFLQAPTRYFEEEMKVFPRGKTAMEKLPKGKSIKELACTPYDISRVKILKVGDVDLVVKRANREKIKDNKDDLEEYNLTKQAAQVGMSTAQPIGYVKDRGNVYLIFERLQNTRSLLEIPGGRLLSTDKSSYASKVAQQLNVLQSNLEAHRLIVRYNDLSEKATFSDGLAKIIEEIGQLKSAYEQKRITSTSFENGLKDYLDYINRLYRVILLTRPGQDIGVEIHEFTRENLLDDEVRGDLEQQTKKARSSANAALEEVSKELIEGCLPNIEYEELGAKLNQPYQRFLDRVAQLEQTSSIKHKDKSRRNILVKMDKKGRLIPDANGDAQFYLIDWEQK